MSKTQIFVQQADGTAREVEIASGGVLLLNADEHLFIAASSDQAQVETGAPGEVIIKLEGVGEFTVESAEEIPEQIAMAPEVMGIKPLPTIVFEPTRTDLSDDAPTHEPLGVHQARVDSTAFLDRQTGDDFGMGQLLDMAEFSGMAGEGLAGRKGADDTDEDDMLADSLVDALSGDPGQDHRNLPPVIDLNKTLLVDDEATEFLTGHLMVTDRESGPEDLKFRISQGPAYGVLMIDGEKVDATRVTFTQADIDSGRVTFRFVPHAQDTTLVLEDDSFTFTVTDGVNTTGPATFRIHNTTVQVWGTGNDDDLTGVANFDRADTKFHVYGFDGNDILRGGSGADTLDGGEHAYASHTPWLYTQEGGDTVDYSASGAAVDVDLTREVQSGGHAEDDVLRGIENVIGSASHDSIVGDLNANLLVGLGGDDTLTGDAGNDTLRGGAGADLIDGGAGQDFADYRTSASWVNVDLNIQDGTTAQSGGGADNDAIGDTLVGIENLIGSNNADYGDVLTGNAGANHLIGLDGDDTLIGGAGNDTLVGGAGADRIDGGAGIRDLADYSASTVWVNVDLTKQDGVTAQSGGGAGNHAKGDILTGIEDVRGSSYKDVLTGNNASNYMYGGDGNDTMRGDDGTNFASTYWGSDTMYGEGGNDYMVGGNGKGGDSMFGGDGNDTMYGGRGIDSMWGNAGDDYMYGGAEDGTTSYGDQDLLFGGTGNDTLVASAGTFGTGGGRCTLVGAQGADRLIGDGYNTEINYQLTGDGYHDLNYNGVYVDLNIQDGRAQTGGPAGNDALGDIITGVQHVTGSYGSDTILGDHQDNEFCGLDGNDLLIGGEGNDSLWGWNGNDTMEGGAGADYIDGGMGYDTADYSLSEAAVRVDLYLTTAQTGGGEATTSATTINPFGINGQRYVGNHALGDVLVSIENVTGSAHDDTLIGNDGDNVLSGLGGADLLDGGGGDDTLIGGAGDTVDGGAGHDVLRSGDEYLDVASSTTITNIERVDLTGACKGLTVSGGAILLNGVADPAGSGLMALVVNGDADDLVIRRSDGWTWTMVDPDVTVDGVAYVLYEGMQDGQTVRLYVQANVASVVYEFTVSEVFQFEPPMPCTEGPCYDDGFLALLNSAISSDVGTDDPSSSIEFVAFWYSSFYYDGNMPGTEGPGYSSEVYFRNVIANDESGYVSYGDTWCGTNNSDLMTGSVADDYMNGWGGNDSLIGGDGNDTLLGGDGDDLLVGGLGDLVHGGSGFDTFRLEDHAGTGSALDLTAMNDAGRITGIEAIDITGDSDDANTLTLKASDVLDTTGGADTLWVHGDGNDTVTTTDSGWTLVGTETGADGLQYNHYSGYAGTTLVNLMIDTDLANQNVVHA